ncbi:MAG: hypothetical protein JRJ85_04215 [Deltaproteobacteria bacterium]|nr:hypothetical protein [Deltaproteobacteria bacterium]
MVICSALFRHHEGRTGLDSNAVNATAGYLAGRTSREFQEPMEHIERMMNIF